MRDNLLKINGYSYLLLKIFVLYVNNIFIHHIRIDKNHIFHFTNLLFVMHGFKIIAQKILFVIHIFLLKQNKYLNVSNILLKISSYNSIRDSLIYAIYSFRCFFFWCLLIFIDWDRLPFFFIILLQFFGDTKTVSCFWNQLK